MRFQITTIVLLTIKIIFKDLWDDGKLYKLFILQAI